MNNVSDWDAVKAAVVVGSILTLATVAVLVGLDWVEDVMDRWYGGKRDRNTEEENHAG